MAQARRFKSGERSTLPCPVDPDHCLQEVPVDHIFGLRAVHPDLHHFFEDLRDFRFTLLRHGRRYQLGYVAGAGLLL